MSEETIYTANPGKQLIRTVDGVDYQRIPIKTHLITKADRMEDVVLQYAGDKMQEGDILFISEKAVACTQSRAIPMEDIKPRKLAVTLSRYVTKTPAGIGLGIRKTMEMALKSAVPCGSSCRLLQRDRLALQQRGWFYIVAGPRHGASTVPPGDQSLPMPLCGLTPMIHRHRQEAGHRRGPSSGHCGHKRPGGQHPGLLPKRDTRDQLARSWGQTRWPVQRIPNGIIRKCESEQQRRCPGTI